MYVFLATHFIMILFQKFVPMSPRLEVKTKDDIVTKHTDFVESQDISEFGKNYKLNQTVLGEGAFGKVQMAESKINGEIRAVKIIDKLRLNDEDLIRLKYEIDILKNLNHPNIVRLYEIYENKCAILLVTELCDGVELFDEISKRRQLTELEAAIVTKQILQAIAYCHKRNVAHRDLKPENILIDTRKKDSKGNLKLIDFGTSHHFEDNENSMT